MVQCVSGSLDGIDGAMCILGREFMAQCVSDIYFGTRVNGAVCI